MERLTAKQIKKIIYGVTLSDGHIDERGRFELYSKHEEYAKYVGQVLGQITGVSVTFKVKKDKRGYLGYRVYTKPHPYFKNMRKHIYNVRKELNTYNVSRIDEEALAHIYMCDGYTEHAKNRKTNKVQNIGWFCLEAFPREELLLLQTRLKDVWGIETSLVRKPWGFGYRLRCGGENLQKLVSVIYPFVLGCFAYKTHLFYKGKGYILDLPNAEQYTKVYSCVEDIVRHSKKLERT